MNAAASLPRRWTGGEAPDPVMLAASPVLHTRPIARDASGPLLVCGIGTRQMLPFLVAAKSLCRLLGRGRIALVDDGTLTGEDRALLAHHCNDPAIHTARADNAPFPDGNDWAALAALVGRHQADFRVLLDLSHVVLELPAQVGDAIGRNRTFHGPDAHGLIGLSAMGAGPAEARALLARLSQERRTAPEAARRFVHALALNEPGAVELAAPIGVPVTADKVQRAVEALLN